MSATTTDSVVTRARPPGALRAVTRRLGGQARKHGPVILVRIALLAIFGVVWNYISITGDLQYWISTPLDVLSRFADLVTSGDAAYHLSQTLQYSLIGFVIGSCIGLSVGLVLGLMSFVGRVIEPLIIAIYSLPVVALAPLFILWFGIGGQMKIALGCVIVIFLTTFTTLAGVRDVDSELIDVMTVIGSSRYRILKEVILPSALTSIFVGLRTSVPYSLIGVVTGEIITSNRGIGYLITYSANRLDTTGVFAALLLMSLVGTSLYVVLRLAEKKMVKWKVGP